MLEHKKLNKYQSINTFIMNQLYKYRDNKYNQLNKNSSPNTNKRLESLKDNKK